jgi:hypothetical protein
MNASTSFDSTNTFTSRLLLALHVGQEHIPPSVATSSPQVIDNGGAGYGPPLLQRNTPVQSLVESKGRDYDLLCVPLTNSSWRAVSFPPLREEKIESLSSDTKGQRWESYCLLPPESGEWVGVDGQKMPRQLEAEKWRGEGYFKRGEVNVTRSGTLSQERLFFYSDVQDCVGMLALSQRHCYA